MAAACARGAAVVRGGRRTARRAGRRSVAVRAAISDAETGAALARPPRGFRRYETMMLVRPDATEEERGAEMKLFEDVLVANGASEVSMQDRGEQPLAYPIGGYIAACYVVFAYTAPPAAAKTAQLELMAPVVGQVKAVLRQMTFKVD
mmetsp:Transcript_2121/g.7367  ORF Transcript_2121/g.7367 Transcript_2121/m.7367 type:complete len:148 (+) Transcript_2121:53-496(+)